MGNLACLPLQGNYPRRVCYRLLSKSVSSDIIFGAGDTVKIVAAAYGSSQSPRKIPGTSGNRSAWCPNSWSWGFCLMLLPSTATLVLLLIDESRFHVCSPSEKESGKYRSSTLGMQGSECGKEQTVKILFQGARQ